MCPITPRAIACASGQPWLLVMLVMLQCSDRGCSQRSASFICLMDCVPQVSHQGVRHWLHHHRNEHMSARAYRAHALAELSSIPSFNSRCASGHAPDALKLNISTHMILTTWLYICTVLGEDGSLSPGPGSCTGLERCLGCQTLNGVSSREAGGVSKPGLGHVQAP